MKRIVSLLCRNLVRRAENQSRRQWSSRHFESTVEQFCSLKRKRGGATFLQVGANDGRTNDPLHRFIVRHGLNGFCLEPLPAAFELLQKTYEAHPGVVPVQAAIGQVSGTMDLFVAGLPDTATPDQRLDATRKATFSKATAIRRTRKLCGLDSDVEAERRLERIEVPCRTLFEFVGERGNPVIDILQIDAEGEDWNILAQASDLPQLPAVINLEHKSLSSMDREAMAAWFTDHGYVWFEHGRDTCGLRLDFV